MKLKTKFHISTPKYENLGIKLIKHVQALYEKKLETSDEWNQTRTK